MAVSREKLIPPPTRSIVPRGEPATRCRPCVKGKFIYVGETKLYVRGATYGTFRPRDSGHEYPEAQVVQRDFHRMSEIGLNAVRTYTAPPRWLLDIAWQSGLYVMVGLPIERHLGLLTETKGLGEIEEVITTSVRACAGHPAVLGYAIGNEFQASMVRWYGRRHIERLLERFYRLTKAQDPTGLVTYVNYPTTEYLQLPFLDFTCFNIYLENQERFAAYLKRVQNIVGDRPLVMSEIGLDSQRNGEETQAKILSWMVRTSFATGCAGAFVYAWTDEWFRGGAEVHDWDFGLTRRDRRAKPALRSVQSAFAEVPFSQDRLWPFISVVICSYNGSRTIGDCLEGLKNLQYSNFEVIVVDDGSQDTTAAIAREYGFPVISTPQRGLSRARNTGMEAASGEIVAYIDDDAHPDPHWLTYLAASFMTTSHAGIGGPNIAPPGDGFVADCVARAPGNPVHVLLSDQEAEHIPGCNMAFRKEYLQSIGGFDSQYRIAGDDVDVCWRLQKQGLTLGFNPAAMVWHHCRNSVRAYWRQQYNYGRAEGMLETKWPEKYNAVGHMVWTGRIYDKTRNYIFGWGGRIYHGIWGTAPFQSLYQPASGVLAALPLMPEWYLISFILGVFSLLGFLWEPLLLALPLLLLTGGASIMQAGLKAARSIRNSCSNGQNHWRFSAFALTTYLYLIQPLARLWGRSKSGLMPLRQPLKPGGFVLPWRRKWAFWAEQGLPPDQWLQNIEDSLKKEGIAVFRGGNYDRWDLELRGGILGSTRLMLGLEEHGGGAQLLRIRSWPRCFPWGAATILLCTVFGAAAGIYEAYITAALFGLVTLLLSVRSLEECTATTSILKRIIEAGMGPITFNLPSKKSKAESKGEE